MSSCANRSSEGWNGLTQLCLFGEKTNIAFRAPPVPNSGTVDGGGGNTVEGARILAGGAKTAGVMDVVDGGDVPDVVGLTDEASTLAAMEIAGATLAFGTLAPDSDSLGRMESVPRRRVSSACMNNSVLSDARSTCVLFRR